MKRIGIVGAGQFGGALATSLARLNTEVIVMDKDRRVVQHLADVVSRVVQGDGTDANALKEAGFSQCDAVIVAIGQNMEASILVTMNLHEMDCPFLVVRAGTEMHSRIHDRNGADRVVHPDIEQARRLARSLVMGKDVDYYEIADNVSVTEMTTPERYVGLSLAETNIRKRYGITVLAIRRSAPPGMLAKTLVNPPAETIIEADDTLVLFGEDSTLETLVQS
jgi:trk system potassium uptake protein TrkA